MNLQRSLTDLLRGALLGAFAGCLVGLAEFTFIFLNGEASYSASLPLAYKHIVYPFIALGILVGLLAAGLAVLLSLLTTIRSTFKNSPQAFLISILLALITLAYLTIYRFLAARSLLASMSLGMFIVVAASFAGLIAVAVGRALHRRTPQSQTYLMSARKRSWYMKSLLLVFVVLAVTLPPPLLELTEPKSTQRTQSRRARPNVVFILVDTLRADHMSLYGYSRRTTPNLEKLAERSLVFTQASAASSWTKPSVATIFSSLYPGVHKAHTNQDFLSGSVVTLAEALRDSGYITICVTANPLISPTFGFTQGFTHVSVPETISPFRFTTVGRVAQALSNRLRAAERRDQHSDRPLLKADPNSAGSRVEQVDWEESQLPRLMRSSVRRVTSKIAEVVFGEKVGSLPPGDGITDTALSMARRNQGPSPMFLYVHYIDPHDPYAPPEPYDRAFNFREDPPIRSGGVGATRFSGTAEDREWLGETVDLYDGEILFVDSQIGLLLSGLEESGLLEDAIVIVTSDHGEEFLDHGGTYHGKTLYEEVLRVPLILTWPGLQTPGLVSDRPVGQVDLMPTILQLAGVDNPGLMQGESLIAELADGGKAEDSRPYFGQVMRLEMARITEFKLIRDPGKEGSEEIYNLALDPLERDNLASSSAVGFADLFSALDEFSRSAESLGQAIEGQKVSEEEEALKALRALGYIE